MKIYKGLLVLSAVSAAVASQALIVIDDFSTGAVNMTTNGATMYSFQNGSMVGGDRFTELNVSGNQFGLQYAVDTTTGLLSVSSQPGVDGNTKLGYGYLDTGTGAGFDNMSFDFSGESRFEIDVFSNDLPATITIALRNSVFNGGTILMVTKNVAGGMVNTPQTITWDFTEFGGFPFNDVDQILVDIETAESGDITLDEIRAVPEPGTMIALGAGAALLASRRRRKN